MASESGKPEASPQSVEEREADARIRKLSVEARVLEERLAFEQRSMEEKRPLEAKEAAARIEKLELEKLTLRDQLTRGYRQREWLKAATGLAAILTLLWTVGNGFQQLRDNLIAREQERLERAVVRMVSDKIPERLSGVTLLRTFLSKPGQGSLALSYFSNTMVGELDAAVRQAILDAISSVNPEQIDQAALNDALAALVGGNRNLTQKALSSRQERRFLLVNARANSGDAGRLTSISRAIVSLLGKGARIKDMSGIYCAGCDFHEMALPEAIFDRSFLAGANFAKANLAKASFDGALLARTDFAEANLQEARFTLADGERGFAVEIWKEGGIDTIGGPSFRCADLRRADFSGQPFFGFIEDIPKFIAPINAMLTDFRNANLDQANFKSMGVYVILSLRDAKLASRDYRPPPAGLPPDLDGFKRLSDFPLPLGPMGAEAGKTFADPGFAMFYGRVDEKFNPPAQGRKEAEKYRQNLDFVSRAFAHSNWSQALLPQALRESLAQRNTPNVRKESCVPSRGGVD